MRPCSVYYLCTSNTLIIFTLETIPMLIFYIKLVFFFRLMDDSHKRSHVETGNTPHKPAEKKAREIESTHQESPVRQSLGFQERSSPAQKVIVFMNNLCKMYVAVYLSSCMFKRCISWVCCRFYLPPFVAIS